MSTGLLITPDGTMALVETGTDQLTGLYELLECRLVEVVEFANGGERFDAWVDEEGAIRNRPELNANPVACHQIAEANDLAVLTVILNNAGYGAVRKAVLGMYPNGYASKAEDVPMTAVSPIPDFVQVAQASRAHAERVDDPAALPAALARAIEVVTVDGRQALLDVHIDE